MRNGLNTLISIEIYRLVKLILTTSVFLSTSLWASPMDSVCSIYVDKEEKLNGLESNWAIEEFIKENCERNNIISFFGKPNEQVFNYSEKGKTPYYMGIPFNTLITSWCRFDRNLTDETDTFRTVTCVLYDNEPRQFIQSINTKSKE